MKLDKKRFEEATHLAKRRQEAKNLLAYLRDMNGFNMTLGNREPVSVYGSLKDSLAIGLIIEMDKIDNELHALDINLES